MRWSLRKMLAQGWWVFALLSICFLLYLQGMKEKQLVMAGLDERIDALEKEKRAAVEEQEDLNLKMESFEDPDYVEMTLMKELGLVPEGQEKVIFDP